MALEHLTRAAVILRHDPLDLLVDLHRRLLAIVRLLREISAQKNLLFLFAEGERTKLVAHSPLTDHLTTQIGCAIQIVTSARCDVLLRQLLCDPAAK